MTRPPLTPHDRASVLILSRRVGEALAEIALDPGSGLPERVRASLADIVCAVDLAACARLGVEPPGPELREVLRAALAEPGVPRAPPGR